MRKNNNGNASTKFCSNCGIPLPQYPLMGRPWNGAPPAYYCCYGCLAVGEEHKEKQQITENTDTSQFISRLSLSGWKLGISILIVSQIMIFGIAVNLHRDISSQTKLFVKIIIMIGAIIVSIVLGSNLLKTVYINLVQRRISIELLFLITLLGSFIASCDSLVNDYEYTYFEVIPILLITYTLGNIIVAKARERAIQKAASWSEEICIARKVTTNQEYCLVPVDKIEIGDYIQVRPGELVPVNGVITQGTAYVFSHLLTGNQHPMIRRINDIIYAGEIVYDSVLYIRVAESGKDRWINSIINTVKKTQTDIQLEPSYVNWITKIFVKILIIVSLVTFLYWYVLQEVPWHRALYYSSSVLLVSCPCVFGIAIPLITWRTIRLLADNGLIVRKHDFIRKIPEITCIVFDKTGTLTHIDKYDIEIITPLHGQERNILLSQLSFIEQHTNHPVAVALRDLYNHTAEHNRCILHKLTIVPACGITAEIEQDGTRFTYDIGTSDWILKICDTSLFKQVWNINENSNIHGSILISRNKVLLCIMNLRERWHDNIDNILEKLINMRVKIYILTGEKDSYIYNSKNVVLCTNMSPAQKEQFVQMKIEQKEKVLYIGDGINDVPAMCCSYVSIGIASRSDLVASLTDAILYNRDLGIIP
ncbi:MAG: HAD-IC family P-type ATPase, partial [Thermogemmata sp.]|nr:HAD-IC family P-type ATPase [Thermogemmata sp.]